MRYIFVAVLMASPAQGGTLVGYLSDKNGAPVADAVLFAIPLDAPVPPARGAESAIVAQEGFAFAPYVSVIRVGATVRFPNRDPFEHHVKSFSSVKSFDLGAYTGKEEPPPLKFDKPGEVALVCHFHDTMRGFIYVLDTPYFAKTDAEGNAWVRELPAGRYEVKAWAPLMLGPPLTQQLRVEASGFAPVRFQFNFVPKPAPKPRPPLKPRAANV